MGLVVCRYEINDVFHIHMYMFVLYNVHPPWWLEYHCTVLSRSMAVNKGEPCSPCSERSTDFNWNENVSKWKELDYVAAASYLWIPLYFGWSLRPSSDCLIIFWKTKAVQSCNVTTSFFDILPFRKQSLTFLCSHWSSFWPRCYETLSQALIRNLASLHASENGDISIQALALEKTKWWRWEERRDCLAAILTAWPGENINPWE